MPTMPTQLAGGGKGNTPVRHGLAPGAGGLDSLQAEGQKRSTCIIPAGEQAGSALPG